MLCYIKIWAKILNYKNVQKPMAMANCYGGERIQNITQTCELFEAAEENYRDDAVCF